MMGPSSYKSLPPRSHPPKPGQYMALEELGSATKPASKVHRWRDGYLMGIVGCAATAASVLLLNCCLTIVAKAKHNLEGGYGILQQGDCNETKRLDLWLHLLINILSTLLLGASNYSMQCLSAPTREEIDKAHLRGTWLDIGVPSIRNLASVTPFRRILWILLLLSSIPLHLLYNSVIFASTSYAQWQALAVTPDFMSGAPYYVLEGQDSQSPSGNVSEVLIQLRNSKDLVRLDNKDCLDAYSGALEPAWSSVLIVTTQGNPNTSFWNLIVSNGIGIPSDWLLCSTLPPSPNTDCSAKQPIDPNDWPIYVPSTPGSPQVVDHCLAIPAIQHCQIRFSLTLMVVVIVCNCIKVICIGTLAWQMDSRPLVTLGDALASMLERPDKTTRGNCLSGKQHFGSTTSWSTRSAQAQNRRVRWFASASRLRWITTTALCMCTIIAAALLLQLGVSQLSNPQSGFSLGFGATNVDARLTNQSLEGNIVGNILVANSPQLLLSFLYFAYNGLWTCMLLSQEWFNYARSAKGLRVTSSRGKQRSTYRLQLPYRYGVPIMIMSGLLHWLVSQSIFLLLISAYDMNDNEIPTGSYTTCGYSPIAILTSILVGSLTLVVGLLNGFRRFPATSMPLATSCSAVISAACHPPQTEHDGHLRAVQWGVCRRESGEAEESTRESENRDAQNEGVEAWRRAEEESMETEVGHCSFTSMPVDSPLEGQYYAGIEKT